MPCLCETNLKAIFVFGILGAAILVLGILGAVFSGLALPFGDYAGIVGIAASICFIVGAKSPNDSALLAGMILAIIECIGMIVFAIYLLYVEKAVANATADFDYSQVYTPYLNQHVPNYDIRAPQNTFETLVIVDVGVGYAIGVIMFQIWIIIVANKARKEIGPRYQDLNVGSEREENPHFLLI